MATATETRQATCEERIAQEAQDRLEDMARFNHKYERANEVGEYNAAERLLERQQEMPLSVDRRAVYDIHLSTGGPADWFRVWLNDGEIQYIEYHFSDWFDHAERNLTGSEFETAKTWIEQVIYLEELE